jgi:hypothetical protein
MQLNGLRVVAALLLPLTAACGGGCEEHARSSPPPNAKRVDQSKAANVTGRVLVEGNVPDNPPIKVDADPVCARANAEGATFETFLVKDGGLENVFVYLKDGLGDYYFDTPAEPVKLDQQACRYKPHVFGIQARQPLEVSNSDPTLHNVHAVATANREFNFGQHVQGMKNTATFTRPEVMVRIKCDVHNWMSAYAGVVEHPYYAVTSGGGRFELKHVPAGTYTVEAWHEKLGTQTQKVTLAENGSREMIFTFKATASTN